MTECSKTRTHMLIAYIEIPLFQILVTESISVWLPKFSTFRRYSGFFYHGTVHKWQNLKWGVNTFTHSAVPELTASEMILTGSYTIYHYFTPFEPWVFPVTDKHVVQKAYFIYQIFASSSIFLNIVIIIHIPPHYVLMSGASVQVNKQLIVVFCSYVVFS